MSRFAKNPIPALPKVTVSVDAQILFVKGPLGTLERTIHSSIKVEVGSEGVSISAKNNSKLANALTGTFAAHLKNMMLGVTTPFKKVLILDGIGYKTELKGKELVFAVGFSHPVICAIPDGITVEVVKNTIHIGGIDKEQVGQFAATIRAIKPPEPYLGKGFHYEGEVIRRKQGKKSV
ncbi:MAG TPA: 50S ribosomal protein L6 [Candidatus Kaiserbacteria bacterium]|nr:50S ribosomal protein L6 [Candidatus Kaiserbacteria bacterium]